MYHLVRASVRVRIVNSATAGGGLIDASLDSVLDHTYNNTSYVIMTHPGFQSFLLFESSNK